MISISSSKAVPFVELTVAHASVLTILAISFERYYAICKPLMAGYVCTKNRAMLICLLAWALAAVFSSPVLSMTEFKHLRGSPSCLTEASTAWRQSYYLVTITCLFILPFLLLLLLYLIIARHLVPEPRVPEEGGGCGGNARGRRQVVVMLGTVVGCFFICLLPFRVFMVWVILASPHSVQSIGMDWYYILLFFCRIMLYLNSAVNPILYNLMSSKFRDGFMSLCGLRRRRDAYFLRRRGFVRSSTINTTTLSLSLSGSRRVAVNGGTTRMACSNNFVRTGSSATVGCKQTPESFV